MAYTISTHNGTTIAWEHNYNKKFRDKEEHIDKDRPIDILEYSTIKEKYHKLFDEAIEEFNNKQKRKDRRIDDYYTKISKDKNKNVCYEMIAQVGNFNNRPSEELQEKILKEFYESFKKDFPNMEIVACVLHKDEANFHLHLNYIPVKHSDRGLKTQVSMGGALSEMGYEKSDKFSEQPLIIWTRDCNQLLENICNKYGLEIEHPERDKKDEEKAKHMSIKEFRDNKTYEEIEYNNTLLEEQERTININNDLMNSQDELIAKNDLEIKNMNSKISKQKESYDKNNDILRNMNNKITQGKAYIEKMNNNISSLSESNANLQEENNNLEKENNLKKQLLNSTIKDLNSFEFSSTQWAEKGKKTPFSREKVYNESEVQELFLGYKKLEEENRDLRNTNKSFSSDIDSLRQLKENNDRTIKKLCNEISTMEEENRELKKEIRHNGFLIKAYNDLVNYFNGQEQNRFSENSIKDFLEKGFKKYQNEFKNKLNKSKDNGFHK